MRSLAAVLLFAAACGGESSEPRAMVVLTPCHVAGLGAPASCGTVPVPLDRGAPAEQIALHVVRLRARSGGRQHDPLFMLAGGPGQASTEAWPPMVGLLSRVVRDRDVVFVDQRGTGSSHPLDCEVPDALEEHFRDDSFVDIAAKCVAKLGVAPGHYSTASAADDLEDVRVALGYDRINVLGSSYGSRLALTFAQRHPTSLRSMILDAVAPPSLRIPLPLAKDAQRALDLVFERCAAEPGCNRAFPHLQGDFARALARFDDGPLTITVPHPKTGVRTELSISREGFAAAVRMVLYSPELQSLLPLTVHRAAKGDYDGLVAQVALFGDGLQEHLSFGLFLSIVCTEDMPRITPREAAREGEGTFMGDAMYRDLAAACAVWPRGPLPERLDEPVVSDVPALLLSGGTDPVTPPRWANMVAAHLSQHRHVVLPSMSHGIVVRYCVPHLIADFLDAPTQFEANNEPCIDADALPFFVDFAGPGQ
jgi:pimeloyl-ACP methyl ester carboxylesterase